MKRLLNITLISSLIIVNTSVLADTLEDVVEFALNTNPVVRSSYATKEAAEAEIKVAKARFYPVIDVTAGISKDTNDNSSTQATNGGSLTLTQKQGSFIILQNLFEGLATKYTVDQNTYLANAAGYNLDTTQEDIAIQSVAAYIEVLKRKHLVTISKVNLNILQDIYQQIQLRSESGLGKIADLDQAISRLALARTNLMAAQENLNNAEYNYRAVIGKMPRNLVEPTFPSEILPNSEDSTVSVALEKNPAILSSDENVYAANARRYVTRANYFPKIDVTVSGSQNENTGGTVGTSKNFNAGFVLFYNLFKGGADRATELAAAWNYEQSKEQRVQTRRSIERAASQTWNVYSSLKSQLEYFRQRAEASTRTRDAYQEQFNIGQRSLLDLLDSENENFSARSAYIESRYNELLSRYQLLNVMGLLVDYINRRECINSMYDDGKMPSSSSSNCMVNGTCDYKDITW